MNLPKISVIVAIYNAEKYLHKCINSILSQSFEEFELILVDDGSVDDSGKICEEYAKIDSRIRVYHKINEGVASARQFAISQAYGTYSIYVDADDWIEPNMLYELYQKSEEDNCDILMCDYYVNHDSYEKYIKQDPVYLDTNSLISGLLTHLHGSLCNKMIRLSCYKDYQVTFDEGLNYCEDLIVCLKMFQKTSKISYLPKAYYHYVQTLDGNSITRNYTYVTYLQRKLFLNILSKTIDKSLYYKEYSGQIVLVAYEAFCHNVLTSRDYKNEFGKYKYEIINSNSNLKMKLFVYLSVIGLQKICYRLYSLLR